MLCERCKKNEASIFVQQFVNNEKKEYHLCKMCAAISYSDFSIENMFQGLFSSIISGQNFDIEENTGTSSMICCKNCGINFNEISKIGKVGCYECYEIFNKELTEAIKNVQGVASHNGKIPQKSGSHMLILKKIDKYKKELQEKIVNEEYEEAAKIRDIIKNLEKEYIKE